VPISERFARVRVGRSVLPRTKRRLTNDSEGHVVKRAKSVRASKRGSASKTLRSTGDAKPVGVRRSKRRGKMRSLGDAHPSRALRSFGWV
jgi:hypothetical protein